jgi:flagellar motor switch/type III secretory pathway protein FliN
MASLTPDIAADIAAICKTNVAEVEAAFTRGLDGQAKLSIGQPGTVDIDALPQWLGSAGLAVVLIVGEAAAVVLIPEESGILPSWCANPDPTGQSKLTTLAQELGMLLLPEQYMPDDFKAAHVKSLHGAVARGGISSGAALVPIQMESAEGRQATAALVWPATKPQAIIGAGAAKPKPTPAPPAPKPKPAPAAKSAVKSAARVVAPPKPKAATVETLPSYSRSLLRIKVPVIVTLAQKRQPLSRVIELGPGSIIQFDKSCEEMLELDVGGRPVATGEAVKVGDKFGLRITSVVLPEERFHPVPGKSPRK